MKTVRYFINTLFLVYALFFTWEAHAQDSIKNKEAQTVTLADAIKIALQNNPQYRAAGFEVIAANGRSVQAGRWNNPSLFFEAEEWPTGESITESRYKMGLSQIVPFPGKKRLEEKAADVSLSAVKARKHAKRIDLIRRVRLAFLRASLARRTLDIGSELSEVASSSRNTARARQEAGESTSQEVLRAEIQYERTKSDQADYEREYRTAISKLAVLLGLSRADSIVPIGGLRESAPKELLNKLSDKQLSEHPLILSARARVKHAQITLERMSLEPYPDMTFSLAGGRRESTDETLVDLGFSLPLPLIDTSKGNREEAAANVRKAQAELLQTQMSLSGRLEQWRQALSQLATQVANYRTELLPRAEMAFSMVQTGYKEGEYSFNDLLDTQRTTAEMRLLYEKKLYELNRATVEVESILKPNDIYME